MYLLYSDVSDTPLFVVIVLAVSVCLSDEPCGQGGECVDVEPTIADGIESCEKKYECLCYEGYAGEDCEGSNQTASLLSE